MKKNIIALACYALLVSLWLASDGVSAELVKADSIRKYAFLAKTSREKQEYPEAVRYYRKLITYQPEKRKTYSFLGQVLFAMKDYPAALEAYQQAVAIDSLHRISNLRLYQLHTQFKQLDVAAKAMERVLLQNPADAKNRRKLADLYRRQERTVDAERHYARLVKDGQEDAEILELLAVLHETLGNVEQVLMWRQRLLAIQDGAEVKGTNDQLKTIESMAELQIKTKDYKAAYESLLQLAAIDTLNCYSYFSRLSKLAENNNNSVMYVRGLEGMVAANPRELETIYTLIEWYLDKENKVAGEKWITRGLQVTPQDARLHLFKGDLLAEQGAEAEAIAAFEVARADRRWESIAQQRIWQLQPPETEEEKLKKAFFGGADTQNQ